MSFKMLKLLPRPGSSNLLFQIRHHVDSSLLFLRQYSCSDCKCNLSFNEELRGYFMVMSGDSDLVDSS